MIYQKLKTILLKNKIYLSKINKFLLSIAITIITKLNFYNLLAFVIFLNLKKNKNIYNSSSKNKYNLVVFNKSAGTEDIISIFNTVHNSKVNVLFLDRWI